MFFFIYLYVDKHLLFFFLLSCFIVSTGLWINFNMRSIIFPIITKEIAPILSHKIEIYSNTMSQNFTRMNPWFITLLVILSHCILIIYHVDKNSLWHTLYTWKSYSHLQISSVRPITSLMKLYDTNFVVLCTQIKPPIHPTTIRCHLHYEH